MSTIKINELATSSISLSDFIVKADASGLATKNTVQGLANLISTEGNSQFKGSLTKSQAEATPSDGWYFPSEAGDYALANGQTVNIDLLNKFNILIISGTYTIIELLVIPLDISIENTTYNESDNSKVATMKLAFDKFNPLIDSNFSILNESKEQIISLGETNGIYTNETGVNENSSGFYAQSNGSFTANANYRSVKFTVNDKETYYASSKVSGGSTALAIYLSVSNVFLGNEFIGGTETIYTNQLLTLPEGTTQVGISYFSGGIDVYGTLAKITSFDCVKDAFVTEINTRLNSVESSAIGYDDEEGVNENSSGFYAQSNGGFTANANYRSVKFTVNDKETYYASSKVSGGSTALAIYLSVSNVFLGNEFIGGTETIYTNQLLTLPEGTTQVGISYFSGGDDIYGTIAKQFFDPTSPTDVNTLIDAKIVNEKIGKNQWYGKSGIWLGTSIPAWAGDNSYPDTVAKLLNCTIDNRAVSSSRVSKGAIRSLSETIADKNARTSPSVAPAFDLSMSYENRILPFLADADFVVLDHGHNDVPYNPSGIDFDETLGVFCTEPTAGTTPSDASTVTEDDGTVITIEDYQNRNTYLGAMNFLINRILREKPSIRIILVSEYVFPFIDYDASFQPNSTETARIGNIFGFGVYVKYALDTLRKRYHLPIIETYDKLGWHNQIVFGTASNWGTGDWLAAYPSRTPENSGDMTQFQLRVPDGTHPGSDSSYKGNIEIAQIIANQMLEISFK